jgi:hypothetical protein
MTRRALTIGLAACASIAAVSAAGQAQDRAQAVRSFETVREVLQHPRCQNCHIPGNAPLQYDQGLPHAMNVQRGRDGLGAVGMNCSGCHQTQNFPPNTARMRRPARRTGTCPPST